MTMLAGDLMCALSSFVWIHFNLSCVSNDSTLDHVVTYW
jgi:hypothetical protein